MDGQDQQSRRSWSSRGGKKHIILHMDKEKEVDRTCDKRRQSAKESYRGKNAGKTAKRKKAFWNAERPERERVLRTAEEESR